MDFAALGRSPHFRSHWIQRNVSLVRQYTSGISDLFLGTAVDREERLLFRAAAPAESAADAQRWQMPCGWFPTMRASIADGRSRRIGRAGVAVGQVAHPAVASAGRSPDLAPSRPRRQRSGSEADLDTRIDEPEYSDNAGQLAPSLSANCSQPTS